MNILSEPWDAAKIDLEEAANKRMREANRQLMRRAIRYQYARYILAEDLTAIVECKTRYSNEAEEELSSQE